MSDAACTYSTPIAKEDIVAGRVTSVTVVIKDGDTLIKELTVEFER